MLCVVCVLVPCLFVYLFSDCISQVSCYRPSHRHSQRSQSSCMLLFLLLSSFISFFFLQLRLLFPPYLGCSPVFLRLCFMPCFPFLSVLSVALSFTNVSQSNPIFPFLFFLFSVLSLLYSAFAGNQAASISEGDLYDTAIRSRQQWTLAPEYAIMSCAIPGYAMRGGFTGGDVSSPCVNE